MSPSSHVFELRTYHAAAGKLEALNDRFRDHTLGLFAKHGFTIIGFWTPRDEVDTLVYLLAFPDRQAAEDTWSAFRVDPAWVAAKVDSERDGSLTISIESVFLTPTDYSTLS